MKYRIITFLTDKNEVWYKAQERWYWWPWWEHVLWSCFPDKESCIEFIHELQFHRQVRSKIKFKSKVVWP